jgi:zinc transport system ATP-binding protein
MSCGHHNLVTLDDVRVTLGDNEILRGVSAGLRRGQITALIGLNGSGKTTLLRAILKEVPFSGRINFHCGHDHRLQQPQHVGYVPQKLTVNANLPLTVCDLMALALQTTPLFLGVRSKTRRTMEQLLDRVWAPKALLNRPVAKISGGELQRVLLALALFPNPELLLLDEPAAGIDFKTGEKFYDLLSRLNKETGVTVVLVSHDLSVVSETAHHVLCLKDGRIQCQGPPQHIPQMLAQTFGSDMAVFSHDHPHPTPQPG